MVQNKKLKILILLLLPLILGGCFKKANNQPTNQPLPISYNVYSQEKIPQGGYKIKYPTTWTYEESMTNKFPEFNDITAFKSTDAEEFKIIIYKPDEEKSAIAAYKVESQSQTQIASRLANDYLVMDSAGQRLRIIAVINVKYLYFLVGNKPGSIAYDNFINNLTFIEYSASPVNQGNLSRQVKLKLYFDNLQKENSDCVPDVFQEVVVDRPELEIGLIPLAVKALIQLSDSAELAKKNWSSALSINTRLRSFGYENNTAIVNFNDEFGQAGGSCEMDMRKNQIEQTLKALNSVSKLEIKKVEFQVEGQPIAETEQ